ncbi:hypothetical protein PIB30_003750 [Stylosanthes scabra]|uniref:Uncharacterized protein n=1 Tax=Stylosanthes scabra TaxID=79078 RepID=A0ABU6R5L5_9FABA|nr:hypothetical protein [Stylosanthes scabra]
MGVTSEGVTAIINGVQKEAGALGEMAAALREMAAELRNCSNLVFVCIEVFLGGDGSKDVGSAPSQNNVHVVDLFGGPNSNNVGTAGGPGDAALSFPPGLISEWMNDTIMMGNMIHVNSEGGGHVPVNPNPTLAKGSSFEEVSLPPSVRGKMQMRLGEDRSADRSQPGGRRRSSREPTWEVYGKKTVGVTFPSFKLTERYKYSLETAQTIAYIFADKLNAHEFLFKRGHRQMDREDFVTLLPGNEPVDYVMELMAFKTAWPMSQIQARTLWSLPSLFSDFVLGGDVTLEELFSLFKDEWLPKPTGLKYIYVQMKEVLYPSKETNLYLMVVDIPNQKTWLFDNFPTNDPTKTRIYAATAVATALDYFIRVGYKGVDILGDKPPLSKQIPEFVLGVPNMGNPYKDKLWVLLWLQMEHYFCENTFAHPENHIDNVGNKVRMDTALALVAEHVNELKVAVRGLASEDWERRRRGQSTNP